MSQQILNFVQDIAVSALRPHPRNEEFFSNAEGDDYKRLKESIEELGILTPLRVSPDMTIISGHQRYRVAKELGLLTVPVVLDSNLFDENEKLQQLIAANFGRAKNDPVKQGKWIVEYEKLKGIRSGQGGDRRSEEGQGSKVSQEDIARELGVDTSTIRNLKRLTTLHPDIQQLISEGCINATTGFKLISKLSIEEQEELVSALPVAEKLSGKQVQGYIDQLKEKDAEITSLKAAKEAAEKDAENMKAAAAEATDAVKSSQDSERYLSMKKQRDDAREKYRKEYEKAQKFREDTLKANDTTNKHVRELERRLAEAEARANSIPETIYPEDYEALRSEVESLRLVADGVIKSRDVSPLDTEISQQVRSEIYLEQELGGFIPIAEGILASDLANISDDVRFRAIDNLNRLAEIAFDIITKLNNSGNEVVA